MSALGSDKLQNNATARLASLNDHSAARSVFPPFSGKLSVDKGLKLSNENFKQLIEISFNPNITLLKQVPRKLPFPAPNLLPQLPTKAYSDSKFGYFFKGEVVTPLSQLKSTPPFPTPHLLALFAKKAYEGYHRGETDAQYETHLTLPDGWKLLTTATNISKNNGYFGAAYWHPKHKQVVIAHRGTDPTNLGALWADAKGVWYNDYVGQMESASTFAHKIVEVLQEDKREKGVRFQLFFTGHSLGGWLAQITTFTTKYLKVEDDTFLKSDKIPLSFYPHTVVFDSPGCQDMLSQMTDKLDVRLDGRSIDIEQLDITSYLSAPNRINTCNKHVGTIYRIFTDLSGMGWREKYTPLYNLATHNMDKIVQAFDSKKAQEHEHGQLNVQLVVDWPVSAGISGDEEYNRFFEWAEHLNNYHPDNKEVTFEVKGYHPLRYQTKTYDERVCRLSVFCQQERQFLESYLWLRQLPEIFKPKELFSVMRDNQAQEKAEEILKGFEIEKHRIRCKIGSPLQTLVPYVKRLLQLFPEIKENTELAFSSDGVRNRVYQTETRRSVERISHSPIEIKPEALVLREFIEDKQQQVLQLQMVNVDEWTGLIKVYQVLQKSGCLIEGQYTVLTLNRFLTVNSLMDFTTLMQSTETPQLLLMAFEENQLLDDKEKDIFITLFNTIKENPFIKIILTTRSEGNTFRFLEQIGREIFCEGFVARDEQLTWSDITSRSREMLLRRSIKFQGATISLNQLMSLESPAANFLPLGALLEGTELNIADPVPISNGYNESYYIGRTFNYQMTVKQSIYSDKSVKERHVYLANTEQEFQQHCQLYPNSNVYWLEKNTSGKFVWQQSQGSLEALREYIDTGSLHTFTADDLNKLFEQAKRQRVMVISDTAGMGKSTVLTHLSTEIKRTSPAKWVVRIDLNDHTDTLNILKQEQIDMEKVIEFVSERMLKLKPGLEMELFKQCCKQKQETRIVIMLDGFDEISPFYKETVFGLLHALRQTAVEQLWVTTRPHLRQELEDKLQQLSYTLAPFSEGNQVEFLTKFWSLKHLFTEPEVKEAETGKSRLQIYAEHLVKKLAQSISDTDRELAGIPLQTRMLAEAFEEEVNIFCQSAESMPQLEFQLDLLGLYVRFTERKYNIYQEEKFKVSASNVIATEQRERDLKIMKQDHQLLALKVLFTEKQVGLLHDNDKQTFLDEQLTRFGIVQVNQEGKLYFIHRTFAEYYVADFFVNNTSQKVQDFILKDIFQKKEHQVIRVFIDGLLSGSKPSEEMSIQYGTLIDDLGNDCLLHTAASEGNANIITFMLESTRAGGHRDKVIGLLLGQDEEKRTAWKLAAENGGLKVLEIISMWAKENLTGEEIKNQMILATDRCQNTAWHLAVRGGNSDVMQKIWDFAQENLTPEEIKNKLFLAKNTNGNTAWHLATEGCNQDVLHKICNFAKDNLTAEEIKNKLFLATNYDRNTAWHMAAFRGYQDEVQKISWYAEDDSKAKIRNQLLLATHDDDNVAWVSAAYLSLPNLRQRVLKYCTGSLTAEKIKNKLFSATDDYGNTAWHLAAARGNQHILQKIWDFAKHNLTAEEIKNKLFLATNSDGNTAWHLAAFRGTQDVRQKIEDFAKDNLTAEEIKSMVCLATDNDGNRAGKLAAEGGNQDLLQKILDSAEHNLTAEEIKSKLFLDTNKIGNTAWHLAPKEDNQDVLQKIWDFAKANLTAEEIKKLLFLDTNDDGDTAWHLAAMWGNQDVLQNMCDFAKDNLKAEEIKNTLFLGTNTDSQTVWHIAAYRGNPDVLQKICDFAKDNLTAQEIINMWFLTIERYGNTAWHLAARGCKQDVLQKIWNFAKDHLTAEEIKNKLFLATGNNGNTAWHLAVYSQNQEVLHKIGDLAKDYLTADEIKNKLFLATDRYGRTALHLATVGGNGDLLQIICDLAKEYLTEEEIKNKLFLATDRYGNTAWHLAAGGFHQEVIQNVRELYNNCVTEDQIKHILFLSGYKYESTSLGLETRRILPDVLQKIFDLAEDYLTQEEIKNNLFLATDNDGNSAWHMAAYRGFEHVLHKLFDFGKDYLTAQEIKNNLFLATNRYGKTVRNFAAQRGNEDVLQKIWDFAKDNLTEEEIENMFLATGSGGNTSWDFTAELLNEDLLDTVLAFGKEFLTDDWIKNMLSLFTDIEGNKFSQFLEKEGNESLLQKLWDFVKKNVTTEEIKKIFLLFKESDKNSVWHLAAERGIEDILHKFCDFTLDYLPAEMLKIMFLPTDSEGNASWNLAVFWGNQDIQTKVCDWAGVNLTAEEIKNAFFLAPDHNGNTAWHSAAGGGNVDVLQKMLDFARDNLTSEELRNVLFLAKDSDGNTALHLVAKRGIVDVLQKICDLAKEYLTAEEIKNNLILAVDIDKITTWNLAAEGGNEDLLQIICDLAKDYLTAEEIKHMLLLGPGRYGYTAWHLAALRGYQDVLQKIWDFAKDYLTAEEIKNMLILATDSDGITAWHLAARVGNEDVLQKICVLAKEYLTAEEIKNMVFLSTHIDGYTAWHLAALQGYQKVLQKIWDFAKDNLTAEEIKNMLFLTTDSDGNTAWHLAAMGNNKDVLLKIWDFANNLLTVEEIKYILCLATDRYQYTAFHLAAKWGNKDILQKICYLAKDYLTTEEIKNQLFLATDSDGNTAWFLAALCGIEDVLENICDFA